MVAPHRAEDHRDRSKPVDRIVADLAPYVSRDNTQGIVAMGTLYLRVPACCARWAT